MRFHSHLDWLVTWPSMAAICGSYLLLLLAGRLTRPGPYSLRLFMALYNATQIVVCAWMSWGFLTSGIFSLTNPFAINASYSALVEYFMLVHYLSKLLDFTDTFIMVMRNKWDQVSFLHVYHHVSITLVWGYLLQTGDANGTAAYGAMLNSVVHFIMYSHYLYTSFGFENPFKALITRIQMFQFGLCLVHAVVVVFWEKVLPANLAYLQLAYHTIMLLLFYNFIRQQARKRKQQKA